MTSGTARTATIGVVHELIRGNVLSTILSQRRQSDTWRRLRRAGRLFWIQSSSNAASRVYRILYGHADGDRHLPGRRISRTRFIKQAGG